MSETTAKQNLQSAAIRLFLRGPVTTRLLYGENAVWTVHTFYGPDVAQKWLREVARPEVEPVTADTRWRLREDKTA